MPRALPSFLPIVLPFVLLACAPAATIRGDSPATRLYSQATQYLQTQYYGYSSANLEDLIVRGQSQLEQACASQATSCPYAAAQTVLRQLLETLGDDHTYLLTPEQSAARQNAYFGLGSGAPQFGFSSVYRENSGARLITDTAPNMPAQAAGLRRGDLITHLEGVPLPKDALEGRKRLAEAAATRQPVWLTVRRAGQPRSVILTAQPAQGVPLPSLTALTDGLALLRIPTFDSGLVALEVHQLVAQAVNNGSTGIIVDVRDNPGGFITQCVSTVGALTQQFEVTSAERGSSIRYVHSNTGLMLFAFGVPINMIDLPNRAAFSGRVAVLVNKNTASCGEIAAAGLQQSGRARIIGKATYGVLNTGTLSYGLLDGGAISITVTRTLNAAGQALADRIMPDIGEADNLDVLEREARDLMLERAIQVVQGRDFAVDR